MAVLHFPGPAAPPNTSVDVAELGDRCAALRSGIACLFADRGGESAQVIPGNVLWNPLKRVAFPVATCCIEDSRGIEALASAVSDVTM